MSGINPDGTLIKFHTPKPSFPAAIAASTGDLVTLSLPDVKAALWTKDHCGNIPLIWAADRGQTEALKLILECMPEKRENSFNGDFDYNGDGSKESLVNTRGFLGSTALSRAARGGHLECVRTLLDREDIDPDIPNEKKQYPLHFAAFKKHPEVVKAFLESGKCDPWVVDRKGRTPADDTSVARIRDMILTYSELRGMIIKPREDQDY